MTPPVAFVTVFVADETALFAAVVTVSTTCAGVVVVGVVGVVVVGGGAVGEGDAATGVGPAAGAGCASDPDAVAGVEAAACGAALGIVCEPASSPGRLTVVADGARPRCAARVAAEPVLNGPAVKSTCRSPGARTIDPSRAERTAAELPNGTSFAASRATVAGKGRERPAAATSGIGKATASAASTRERYETAAVIGKAAELQAEP
jgi:hypothetical protein